MYDSDYDGMLLFALPPDEELLSGIGLSSRIGIAWKTEMYQKYSDRN